MGKQFMSSKNTSTMNTNLLKEQMKLIAAEIVYRINSDSKIFNRFPTSLFFGWRQKVNETQSNHSRAIHFPTLPSDLEKDRLSAIKIVYQAACDAIDTILPKGLTITNISLVVRNFEAAPKNLVTNYFQKR